MVSRVVAYALIMLVMTLLFDLTFTMQILSETAVKVTLMMKTMMMMMNTFIL